MSKKKIKKIIKNIDIDKLYEENILTEHMNCQAFERNGTLQKLVGSQPDICNCGASEKNEKVFKIIDYLNEKEKTN